jgi:hypothetical protein
MTFCRFCHSSGALPAEIEFQKGRRRLTKVTEARVSLRFCRFCQHSGAPPKCKSNPKRAQVDDKSDESLEALKIGIL